MPPKIGNKDKRIGELRKSQAIMTFGCGSLIDLPHFSGIISGIDCWNTSMLSDDSSVIHERNLEILLGKDHFIQLSSEGEGKERFSIPAFRFPEWYYCPQCNRLDKYYNLRKKNDGYDLYCRFCSEGENKVKLIPSGFIVSCVNGHLSEFPYIRWAHKKTGGCCSKSSNPELELRFKGNTGGLQNIVIVCKNCGASETMELAMQRGSLNSKCFGDMPWFGKDDNKHWIKDSDPCDGELRVLQRGANNVYYPINESALTIPPWSQKYYVYFEKQRTVFETIFQQKDKSTIDSLLPVLFESFNRSHEGNLQDFIDAAYARFTDGEKEVSQESIRIDEYRAFVGPDELGEPDDFFKVSSVDIPEGFEKYFSKIKQVKKIREVIVLKGFRRIFPVIEENLEERQKMGMRDANYTSISNKNFDWLPANQLFGEGIFIEFNKDLVKSWELANKDRYKEMAQRSQQLIYKNKMFDENHVRYVLLHTFAHLLIRQLSSECGYEMASLKERIYSTIDGFDDDMCGVLIYTSTSDSDGSLGGLVREGETERFGDTLRSLLEQNSWCSNDPLCIESTNQGSHGLNYAACHACSLLPETSCEHFNSYLDRASIVGTPDNVQISYFRDLL